MGVAFAGSPLSDWTASRPEITLGAYVIWFVVLMFVGLVNGAMVGGVTALAKPRQAS